MHKFEKDKSNFTNALVQLHYSRHFAWLHTWIAHEWDSRTIVPHQKFEKYIEIRSTFPIGVSCMNSGVLLLTPILKSGTVCTITPTYSAAISALKAFLLLCWAWIIWINQHFTLSDSAQLDRNWSLEAAGRVPRLEHDQCSTRQDLGILKQIHKNPNHPNELYVRTFPGSTYKQIQIWGRQVLNKESNIQRFSYHFTPSRIIHSLIEA